MPKVKNILLQKMKNEHMQKLLHNFYENEKIRLKKEYCHIENACVLAL